MKLREFLEQRKMTNVEFARLCDVTPVTVCRWVTNKHLPDAKSREMILTVTNGEVTANDLYQ